MPDTPKTAGTPAENETFNDPDLQNSEQNEAGTQAQDVAEDALHPSPDEDDVLESSPGGNTDPGDLVPRDVPDLVDNLNHMLSSGEIDMGAFEGEELMDDEDDEDDGEDDSDEEE
jgi:hypothetical protein